MSFCSNSLTENRSSRLARLHRAWQFPYGFCYPQNNRTPPKRRSCVRERRVTGLKREIPNREIRKAIRCAGQSVDCSEPVLQARVDHVRLIIPVSAGSGVVVIEESVLQSQAKILR